MTGIICDRLCNFQREGLCEIDKVQLLSLRTPPLCPRRRQKNLRPDHNLF